MRLDVREQTGATLDGPDRAAWAEDHHVPIHLGP
jgi:hypothetical protein